MKITKIAVCLGVFSLITSCSHVTVTKTGFGIYPPTQPTRIEIRATLPDRKFDEIGMVSVDAFGDPAQAYNLIREKAAAVGADAVVLQNQMPIGGRVLINGVAIKYR